MEFLLLPINKKSEISYSILICISAGKIRQALLQHTIIWNFSLYVVSQHLLQFCIKKYVPRYRVELLLHSCIQICTVHIYCLQFPKNTLCDANYTSHRREPLLHIEADVLLRFVSQLKCDYKSFENQLGSALNILILKLFFVV